MGLPQPVTGEDLKWTSRFQRNRPTSPPSLAWTSWIRIFRPKKLSQTKLLWKRLLVKLAFRHSRMSQRLQKFPGSGTLRPPAKRFQVLEAIATTRNCDRQIRLYLSKNRQNW